MKGGQRHRVLQFWGRFSLVCLFSGGLGRAHTLVNVLLLVMLLKCGNPFCFANEQNGCFVSRFMPTSERARERLTDWLINHFSSIVCHVCGKVFPCVTGHRLLEIRLCVAFSCASHIPR